MREYLRGLDSAGLKTPAYYLDLDSFEKRVRFTAESLPGIPLTYSIKANPFLLAGLPAEIRHVEVCSPGELDICRARKIPGKRIIYSGVTKEAWDIREAMAWGADLVTAESLRQAEEEAKAAREMGIRQKTLLRLSSGNQFGMSREDLMELLSRREDFPDLDFYGIHYYSGTQKRLKQVGRDLEFLRDFLKEAKEKHGWMPCLVEMGPGLAADYFEPPYEETERETLAAAAPLLLGFALEYPLGVEMGRFLASECGTYATRVKDAKENEEIRYLICDGGINHLKYYGQNMAMQVPDVESLSGAKARARYCICGSLCTTADVLVREAELPETGPGDVILFHRCGAYSITEGIGLFLSRNLPEVYAWRKKSGLQSLRGSVPTAGLNAGNGISG